MNRTLLSIAQPQIRYHDWATREMWRGITLLPEPELTLPKGTSFGTIQATLAHMYLADRVWLNRIIGHRNVLISSIPTPAPSLLEKVWNDTLDEYCAWIAAVTNAELFNVIQYSDSTGSLYSTPTWQILFHVVNHGTGHRGQLNGMIRQAGVSPFSTDLIQFYRH